MPKFRKKPVVIEAFRWTGELDRAEGPGWAIDAIGAGVVRFEPTESFGTVLCIKTLEGTMTAAPGDWIIKGVKGELYPCKPDIFAATYEPVDFMVVGPDGVSAVPANEGQPNGRR